MPLTSIQCWHVHCEECWLRTLVRISFHFCKFFLPIRHPALVPSGKSVIICSNIGVQKEAINKKMLICFAASIFQYTIYYINTFTMSFKICLLWRLVTNVTIKPYPEDSNKVGMLGPCIFNQSECM